MSNWYYYNHALMPKMPPHCEVDISDLKDKNIWNNGGKRALFARWTSDFDCKDRTEWWHCIKDEKFCFEQIKSNYRTKIRKGLKYIDIKKINPLFYVDDIYYTQIKCYEDYHRMYRPNYNLNDCKNDCKNWSKNKFIVYGAFFKDTKKIIGFSVVCLYEEYASLSVLKVPHLVQKYETNAALIYNILDDLMNDSSLNIKYISDGARNIVHKTNFHQYLIKTFGFIKIMQIFLLQLVII